LQQALISKKDFSAGSFTPSFFVGENSKSKAQVLLFGWSLQGGERGVE